MFIVNALVKGDIKTRFDAYASARQNGWMNGDEIRELEDLNPIDGGAGKVFWMPTAMQQASTAAAMLEAEPTPQDQPNPPSDQPKGVM